MMIFCANTCGDRLNLIYSSSIVSKGRGSGIAIGTGLNTEIGSIAKSLQGDSGLIRKVDKSNGRQPQKRILPCWVGKYL